MSMFRQIVVKPRFISAQGDGVAKTLQLLLSSSQGCPICTASKKNEEARVF
jgi:hypothetical protein